MAQTETSTDWLALCAPLVQNFEGCRLCAYPDPATGGAPWTCGWGATGADVKKGVTWTQAQADARLRSDLQRFGAQVDKLVNVPLSAQQKAALVSFVYNVGPANLAGSTLLKLLNMKLYSDAALQFPRWNLAAGKVMQGLVRRRTAEQKMFLTGRWQ